MIKLKIEMNPAGKKNPLKGRYNRFYTHPETKTRQDIVLAAWKTQSRMSFEKGIPLKLTLILGYPIPKATPKKQRALMVSGLIRPIVKPDMDNVIKLVLDSLKGHAFSDDNHFVSFKEPFIKFYAETPFIGVIIEELKEEESRLEVDLAKRIFDAN
jgi:Holliday junction resolvase RusA-like endonuclease